jgi:hypothetical protein
MKSLAGPVEAAGLTPIPDDRIPGSDDAEALDGRDARSAVQVRQAGELGS